MQNCGPGQPVSRYMTSTILLYNGGKYLMIELIFLMKIDIYVIICMYINICINKYVNIFRDPPEPPVHVSTGSEESDWKKCEQENI